MGDDKIPNKKRKKREEHLILMHCLWNGCESKVHDVMQLNDHLCNHLADIPEDSPRLLQCRWSDCSYTLSEDQDDLMLRRHIHYHAYFEALLARGKYECLSNPEIPPCNGQKWTWDKIPPLTDDFRCQWGQCERSFVSIVEFQDHIEQHANFDYDMMKAPDVQRRKIQCCWSFCQKEHDNRYRLVEHVTKHSLKKLMGCHHCGELFRCKTNLFDHLRRQPENNTNKNQCAQCFKFFATDKLFRAHVLSHVNCFKCTMCDMTCSSGNALSVHIRYRHLKDKPVKCTECDYCCVRKSDLERHLQWFHRKERVKCTVPGCGYTVRSYYTLKRHTLEMHKNRPFIYMCHCCERLFKNGKTMSAHLIKKHNYSLPSGHKRFIYRISEDGFYRLETTRIESQEVTEQILTTSLRLKTNNTENDQTDSDDNSGADNAEESKSSNNSESTHCFSIVNQTNGKAVSDPIIVSTDNKACPKPEGQVIISLPAP